MTWFSEPNKKVKWCICGGNVSFIYSFYIITKPGRQSEKLSAGKKIKLFYWAPLFHLLVQIPHCQNQNYFQTKVNTCSRSTGGAFHSTASFYEHTLSDPASQMCHGSRRWSADQNIFDPEQTHTWSQCCVLNDFFFVPIISLCFVGQMYERSDQWIRMTIRIIIKLSFLTLFVTKT